MMNILKTTEYGTLATLDEIEKGCWVDLINPTEEEMYELSAKLGTELYFLQAALDPEESSRIEQEEGQTLFLVDIPIIEEEDGSQSYRTIPLAIVVMEDLLITVCLKDNPLLRSFRDNRVKGFFTQKKYRFILQILYRMSSYYLTYLKQIDKKSSNIEHQLQKSMRNKELFQLFALAKSLVYFSTSLKANEIVLEKMLKIDAFKLYAEDQEILEDALTEIKQAIEMANIYSGILSGMMDAFASIISNNLNIVMKFLASITIVLSLPTMVASFYGMNVRVPLQNSPYAFLFTIAVSLVISAIAVYFLVKNDMF